MKASSSKIYYLQSSRLSELFFSWVSRIVSLNIKKPFEQHQHYNLQTTDQSATQYEALNKAWLATSKDKKKHPLFRALFKMSSGTFIVAMVLGIFEGFLFLVSPMAVNLFMKFIEEPSLTFTHLIGLIIVLPAARIGMTLISSHASFTTDLLESKLKTGTAALIYSKTMKVSLIRSEAHTIGSLMNNYEIDCDKISSSVSVVKTLIVVPLQLLVGVSLVFYLIGYSFFAGVLLLFINSILNFHITKKFSAYQEELMTKKDNSTKLLNEVLNAIKYIKMSGWENLFIKKMGQARSKELEVLRKNFILDAWSCITFLSGPQGIFLATLTTSLILGDDFDIKSLLILGSIFWELSSPFQTLSEAISNAADCKVSLQRVEKFLVAKEICKEYIIQQEGNISDKAALRIEGGNFSWKSIDSTENDQANESELKLLDQKFELKDINLEIKKRQFIAIIGDVGSGKSSLLYSLIGEMSFDNKNLPQVEINGSKNLLFQKPWIMSGTLRDNIVFGKDFNQELYDEVLYYSALKEDLKVLSQGDLTEIGEKGINLSGGQKSRVSLARALYNQPEIIILDDILSAVDVHVGSFIVEKCLCQYLKGKTRIIVTHNLNYLKYVDYVYMLDNGRVINQGGVSTLKAAPEFQRLMEKAHQKEDHDSEFIDESAKLSHESSTHAQTVINETRNQIANGQDKKHAENITEELVEQLQLAEDSATGVINHSTLSLFFKSWGGRKFIVVFIVVMFIRETAMVLNGTYVAYWSANATKDQHFWYLFGYYITNLGGFLGLAFSGYVPNIFTLKHSKKLHERMSKALLQAPVNLFFDRVPSGRIFSRFTADLEIVDTEMTGNFVEFWANLYSITATIIMCVMLSNFIVLQPIVIFIFIARSLYRKYTSLNQQLVRISAISEAALATHFSESLQGLDTIRMYQQEKQFLNKLFILQDEYLKNLILKNALAKWNKIKCTNASLLVIFTVSLIVTFYKDQINISIGYAGVFASYMMGFCDEIFSLLNSLAHFEAKLVVLERLHKFTQITSEKIEPEVKASLPANWPDKGKIEFENYTTQYRPGLPLVLDGLDLALAGGEKVGVVGRTGSGKSTMMLSLLRIIEAKEGAIKIDGVSIDQVSLPELRNAITAIPQDPQLFEGTLRENVDILGEYSDEEVIDALEAVNIRKNLEGIEMHVKSGGDNFSAGERQMICIARALLKKSKIILIDEATSNIDLNNEEVFLQTIKKKFSNSTVVTIAHRLNTIRNSDKIVVLSQGKVVETGSPENLMKQSSGIFAQMWSKTKVADVN